MRTYVEAFKLFGLHPDHKAERSLEQVGLQAAAGAIAGISGEIDLMQGRTRRPMRYAAGHHYREIHAEVGGQLERASFGYCGKESTPSQRISGFVRRICG
jgi:hypothetical protein